MKPCIPRTGPEPSFFFPLPFGSADPGKHEHLHVCDRICHLFPLPGHHDLEHLQRPQGGQERTTIGQPSGPARHGRHGELLTVPSAQRGLTPAFLSTALRESTDSLKNVRSLHQFESLASCVQDVETRSQSTQPHNGAIGTHTSLVDE